MRYLFFAVVLLICFSQVAPGFASPTLTVTEARRGSWPFIGLNDPTVIIDDPAGCDAVPWVLEWTAVPDPGRTIDAYRYGFDILDLNDPAAWDTDWCSCLSAPAHTFYFGTHTFHVEVRDDAGAVTRGSLRIDVVPTGAPTLTLSELTRGSWVFIGLDSPRVSLSESVADPPVPWEFEWAAVPCDQGAGDVEYRYGWDIADPDDDNQWSPWGGDLAVPAQTLTAGVHTFMVEARDENAAVTRGTISIEITTGPVSVEKTTWGGIKAKYSE